MCGLSVQRQAQAKEFSNLDFEDVIQPLVYVIDYRVPLTNALPGWSEYLGGASYDLVVYNKITIGGGSVCLQGPGSLEPILQGNYSVVMQGTDYVLGPTFAIGQTGQIPITAKALQFWAYELRGLEVSFNDHQLPYVAIENGTEHTVYGVDISPYAGQTGELLFTAPPKSWAYLDNIQFSSEPFTVPEPGTVSLFALGAIALVGRLALRKRD